MLSKMVGFGKEIAGGSALQTMVPAGKLKGRTKSALEIPDIFVLPLCLSQGIVGFPVISEEMLRLPG